MKRFKIDDEVIIRGIIDEIFTVESYFEQGIIDHGKQKFELWYTVKSKSNGDLREVSYTMVSAPVKIENTDDMLDEYIKCRELESIFGDGEYRDKAEYILDKLKYKLWHLI